MATVNFSVPDDIKTAFDRAFKDRNKSSIIADLMRRAVEESRVRQRRLELFHTLTTKRSKRPSTSAARTRVARLEARA